MSLDIGALVNAVARLQEGLERHRREPADEQLRDGLIQRFEFTYELAHRILRRYLRQVSPSPATFDEMPFQDLIRTGSAQGLLLNDWAAWRRLSRHAGEDQPHLFSRGGGRDRAGHSRLPGRCDPSARCVAAAPGMTLVLDISAEHAAIVRDVLRRFLPAGARAFVFGSRAHGHARRYSDLDLALAWDRPLGLRLMGEIAEALSESDLPSQG